MGETVARWVKIGLVLILLWGGVFFWNSYGCRKVAGNEMDPTIKRDSMPVVALGLNKPADYQRGDVVYYEFEQPGTAQSAMAGRVIALPGERVQITEGEVSVNGTRADQSYVAASCRSTETLAEIVVPRDCFYVLCDNRREYSDYDSRGIGPIGRWAIVGKVRQ